MVAVRRALDSENIDCSHKDVMSNMSLSDVVARLNVDVSVANLASRL